eukprot:UN00093
MSFGQYSMMMNRMNPLGLPQVSQGMYAQRRRVLDDDDYDDVKVIRKCVYDDKEVCIGYDYESGLYMVDVMICNGKKRREREKRMGMNMSMDDIGFMVYKYENICDMVKGYGEFDDFDDYVQYFVSV